VGEHVRTRYLTLALARARPLALTSSEVIWWASTCAASSMIRSSCSGTWARARARVGARVAARARVRVRARIRVRVRARVRVSARVRARVRVRVRARAQVRSICSGTGSRCSVVKLEPSVPKRGCTRPCGSFQVSCAVALS